LVADLFEGGGQGLGQGVGGIAGDGALLAQQAGDGAGAGEEQGDGGVEVLGPELAAVLVVEEFEDAADGDAGGGDLGREFGDVGRVEEVGASTSLRL